MTGVTRENGLQLLHGGLKRVQERGACYKVADKLRISEPLLDDRACHELTIFAPSLESRASVHSKDYVSRTGEGDAV